MENNNRFSKLKARIEKLQKNLAEIKKELTTLQNTQSPQIKTDNTFNQEIYQSIIENSLDCLYQFNLQTKYFEYISPSCEKIAGFSSEEFQALGEKIMDMIHPDDLPTLQKAQKLSEETGFATVEYRQKTKNGNYCWLSNYMIVVKDSDGKALYRNGSIRDVSTAKEIEIKLNQSEEKYRELVRIAPAAIYEMDIEGTKFLSVNEFMCNILGYQKEELLQIKPRDLLSPESKKIFSERIGKKLKGENIDELVEYQIKKRNGDYIYVSIYTRAFIDENDKSSKVIVIAHDISERKRIEGELRKSEARLTAILNLAPVAVWIAHDPDCKVITGNNYANQIMLVPKNSNISASANPKEAAVSYKMFKNGFTEPLKPEEMPAQIAASKGQTISPETFKIVFTDKRVIYMIMGAAPLIDENNKTYGSVTAGIDITELKKVQENLIASEENYRLLLKYAPTAIYEIDFEKPRFKTVNDAMCQLSGYSREELLITNPLDLLEGDSPKNFQERIKKALKGEKIENDVEYQVRTKNKDIKWALLNIKLTHNSNGKVNGALVVGHDITELKKSEEAKNNFISLLAHELRNPLAPLSLSMEIIQQHLKDGISKIPIETLEMILKDFSNISNRQIQKISLLLDELLDVSRIAQGKIELKKEPIDILSLIKQVIASLKQEIDSHGHFLSASLPENPLILTIDPIRFEQIIGNLLTNAIKYTPDKGFISLSVKPEENHIIIEIKDSGIGIAPEDMSKIFQPFFQTENAKKYSQGGLGLGLMLARKLCELHGGQISVSSEGLNKGAKFTVTLPNLKHEDATLPLHFKSPFSQKKKILILDDNEDAATSLNKLLSLFGHEVHETHTGKEALEIAERFNPDIALLDIGLPIMNGYEVAEALRKQKNGEKIVIIATTGFGQNEDRKRAKESGFNHFLLKPLSLSSIQKIISES